LTIAQPDHDPIAASTPVDPLIARTTRGGRSLDVLPTLIVVLALGLSMLLLWRGLVAAAVLAWCMSGALFVLESRRRTQLREVDALLRRMRRLAQDDASVAGAGTTAASAVRPSTRPFEGWTELIHSLEEQGRLREDLHAMARQLMTVQEDERRVLSRELHDDIGQSITAMKLCALALADETPQARTATIAEIAAIADETMAKLRNLSLLLRPPQLDMLGLEAAIRGQADLMARTSRVRIALELSPLPRRPAPEVELACFRIAQEALTNALRHTDSEEVTLRLAVEDGQLLLEVGDEGRGFDPDGKHGLGMLTMRERAQQAGGTLQITSDPARGSCVRARFPFAMN
jgi:signal transduction histidine kinase